MPATIEVSLSDFLEAALLNHALRNTAFTKPTTKNIGLFTDLNEADDGETRTEAADANYAQQAMDFGTASTANRNISNSGGTITFPAAAGSEDYGWVALFDQVPNFLAWGRINTSYDIGAVDTANDKFTIVGVDLTANYTNGRKFFVEGSTGNDGKYTIVSSALVGSDTEITVSEDVTDATADGDLWLAESVGVGDSVTIESGALTISMVGDISNYAAKKWLDHVFGNLSWTSPTTVYTGLLSAYTDDDTFTELSYTNYARLITAWDAPSAVGGGQQTANTDDEVFAQTDAQVTVSYLAVFDASTAGNLLFRGSATQSESVPNGDKPRIAAGTYTINGK